MLRTFLIFALLLAPLTHAAPARAALVLGTLTQAANDNGALAAFDSTGAYSIGFNINGSPVTLTSVDLRLKANISSGLATLELRNDVAGNPAATAFASFASQTVSAAGFSTFNFTPLTTMDLAANTTYWLTISTTMTSPNGLILAANDPSLTPTGPLATYAGLRTGFPNNQSIDITGLFDTPTFAINGAVTAVPEPSSILLLSLTIPLAATFISRKRRPHPVAASFPACHIS